MPTRRPPEYLNSLTFAFRSARTITYYVYTTLHVRVRGLRVASVRMNDRPHAILQPELAHAERGVLP